MRMQILAAAALLAACSAQPVTEDKPAPLGPGEGYAAVLFSSASRITQISFFSKDPNHKGFEVPDSPGQRSLHLVPVQAGTYCLRHLKLDRRVYESKTGLACFSVQPGKITYSGDLVQDFDNLEGTLDRQFFPLAFQLDLQKDYPAIAAAYPLAAPVLPPADVRPTPSTNLLSTWIQDVPGQHSQAVYFQNNAAWPVRLTRLELYACINIKQPCAPTEPGILLQPFETRQVLVVEPADPLAAWSYEYRFDWQEPE